VLGRFAAGRCAAQHVDLFFFHCSEDREDEAAMLGENSDAPRRLFHSDSMQAESFNDAISYNYCDFNFDAASFLPRCVAGHRRHAKSLWNTVPRQRQRRSERKYGVCLICGDTAHGFLRRFARPKLQPDCGSHGGGQHKRNQPCPLIKSSKFLGPFLKQITIDDNNLNTERAQNKINPGTVQTNPHISS
jgi:hypothetical protein